MKKFLLSIILFCIVSNGIIAQVNYMIINRVDGSSINVKVSDINKVTFVPKTELDNINIQLNKTYSSVYNFYDNGFIKYGDMAGNMLFMSNTSSNMNMYNFACRDTSKIVYTIWKNGFLTIANINNLLYNISSLKSDYSYDMDEINNICAQAYFLRALLHLDLSMCYSQPYKYTSDASHLGIPVLNKVPPGLDSSPRSTMQETYVQVIADLNLALETFPSNYPSDSYNASSLACKALLARVYLYMEKWDLAEQYASEVINKVPLTTRANYVSMYSQNDKGESIFKLSGYGTGKNTSKFYQYGSALGIPADTLYSLYTDSRDIRKNLLYYYPDTKKGKVCMKYYLQNNTDANKSADLLVLRASEMYLIRAEARMKQGNLDNAAADIKALEARALGINTSDVTLNYANAADLDRIIEIESIKELSFEGHRFFDIARQKKDVIREKATNSSVKHLIYPNYRYALPIPYYELILNPLMLQNPGY